MFKQLLAITALALALAAPSFATVTTTGTQFQPWIGLGVNPAFLRHAASMINRGLVGRPRLMRGLRIGSS